MAWLDQLQPASFRNVPFQVDTIDVSAGDNVVLREYPFQDLPTVFRMGEGVEEIKFSAYVIGEDYIDQRDRLRAVLTGEGVLIHPTAGAIRVFVAGKFAIRENPTAEGGMARFDLTFVRAEPRRYPAGVVCTEAEAVQAANAAAVAAQDQFAADFSLDGISGWVSDLSIARISQSLNAVAGGLMGSLSSLTGQLGDLAGLQIGTFQQLRDGLDGFIREPMRLANAVATLFELPTEISGALAGQYRGALAGFFDMGQRVRKTDFEHAVVPAVGAGLVMFGAGKSEALTADTAARRNLARLYATSDQLFETLATSAYVKATAQADLPGYVEALQMRQDVHQQCTRLLVGASSQTPGAALPASAWHNAVAAMHTAAINDIRARSQEMGRLSTYTPAGWEPVWTISYRLYGTTGYADEILALNPHIEHPLLVPPGRALRVIARD